MEKLYTDDTTLMAASEEELKSLLMKVKVESEKVGLKVNTQKTKIMASGPTTSWEIDGETVETDEVKVAQSCLTLCDLGGYTVHGILQARILEWVAFSFSRGFPNPGI